MSEQQISPPAGWYPDPQNPAQQRWWDGRTWGPVAPSTAQSSAPSRASGFGIASMTIGIAVVILFLPAPWPALFGALVGLLFGAIGAQRSKARPGTARGTWITGLILNGSVLAIFAILVAWLAVFGPNPIEW